MALADVDTVRGTFNRAAFAAAVDMVRVSRRMTWAEVSIEADVNPVALSRMSTGKNCGLNIIAALLNWSGLDARSFFNGAGPAVCALCGEPGPGGGSHQSLIDCVMALRGRVNELQRGSAK